MSDFSPASPAMPTMYGILRYNQNGGILFSMLRYDSSRLSPRKFSLSPPTYSWLISHENKKTTHRIGSGAMALITKQLNFLN